MTSKANLIKNIILASEIIGKKVEITNKGNGSYVGLCPFHRENSPSFFVNDHKQFYHCFGCGAHGDIFTFTMQNESVNYKKALIKLASIAGVQLDINDSIITKQLQNNQVFFDIYKKVMKFYQKQLFCDIGKKALHYILSRGIKLEIIKRYNIGFSPRNSSILINELKKGFTEADLYKSGVIFKKGKSEFDPLYNRLVFPIHNQSGNVIAFGGRMLEKGEPKYLNSPESPIFKKSDQLYGYHFAKNFIFKEKEVIIVEGYMDVITLANSGIQHVVAPLGANIQLHQIENLWYLCPEPTICFDNDKAGINAANKIAYKSLQNISYNKSLKFIQLQEAKDPDELINTQGIKYFSKLFSQSIPLSQYIFNIEKDKLLLNTPEKEIALKVSLNKIIENISNSSLKRSYFKFFQQKYYDLVYGFNRINPKPNYNEFLRFKKKHDSEKILIVSILWYNPSLLYNNSIIEELLKINLSNELDKLRRILLDFSLVNENNLLTFVSNYTESFKEKNIINDSVKKLIKLDQVQSQEEIKLRLFRAFNINKARVIKKEIKLLKQQLLTTADDKAMKRMIYLKKYEKQLQDEIIN